MKGSRRRAEIFRDLSDLPSLPEGVTPDILRAIVNNTDWPAGALSLIDELAPIVPETNAYNHSTSMKYTDLHCPDSSCPPSRICVLRRWRLLMCMIMRYKRTVTILKKYK